MECAASRQMFVPVIFLLLVIREAWVSSGNDQDQE
jgi:hypothetical protein